MASRKVVFAALLVAVVAVIVAGFFLVASMSIKPSSTAAPSSEEVYVVDLANRTVKVPSKVERIVSLWPEATRIIIALGAGDKLVGVSMYDVRDPVMTKIYPKLRELPAVGSTWSPNVEEIIKLKPDVIFADALRKDVLDELQKETSVPVIGIRINVGKDGRFTYKAFEVIGEVLGGEYKERGKALAEYLESKLDMVRKRTAEIPRSERLKVYIPFARTPLTAYGLADPPESAGLINVAFNPGKVWYPVNMEQVIEWNPDIIAVHALSPRMGNFTVETLLNDPNWKQIKAVREGRVYNVILGYCGWYPGLTVINTMQLAKIAYPSLFKDLDIVKEGNEIYETLYGVKGFFSEIAEQFHLYVPR